MSESKVLKSEVRNGLGGRDSARLRKKGRIPAVVYGHKETPANISVCKDDLTALLRHHARTVTVEIAGKNETVLIQEIQHDHLGSTVLHVDFRRVSADERVRTTVDIELKGIAPGVISGGVLEQPLHSIHVECPAMAIPESIKVKIDALLIGQSIHVNQLDLPAGVKALEDPEAIVVAVKTAQMLDIPTGEAGANEPEVITKKKEKAADDE
jgi:large subunit ribosomal protein L25